MIIVDTNTIAALYFPHPKNKTAEDLQIRNSLWVAPILWRSEFRNVTTAYLRRGVISMEQALTIMENAEQLMMGGEEHVNSKDVLSLVTKSTCSSYDCEFVALASYLNSPLITYDKQILKEFPTVAMTAETYLTITQ